MPGSSLSGFSLARQIRDKKKKGKTKQKTHKTKQEKKKKKKKHTHTHMSYLRPAYYCSPVVHLALLLCCSLIGVFWCPCTAINVSVQYNNGGLLPDIILLTQCYYYHRGTRLNAIMFSPKPFDNFPPEGGCSKGLDAFRFFLKKYCSVLGEQTCWLRPATGKKLKSSSILRTTTYYLVCS